MNQTIEQIWQQAYKNKGALVVPTVENLYERKSANLVDKIEASFRQNRQALYGGGVAIFVVCNIIGWHFLAFALPACIGFLIWRSAIDIAEYSKLDKTSPSYDYIIEFHQILHKQLNQYANLYRWMYPLMLSLVLLQASKSEVAKQFFVEWTQSEPSLTVYFGIPLVVWALIAVVCGIVSIAAKRLYAWDVDLYYGRQFDKLEEIVTELKELKTGVKPE